MQQGNKTRSTDKQKAAKSSENGGSGSRTNVELLRSTEVKEWGRQSSPEKSV